MYYKKLHVFKTIDLHCVFNWDNVGGGPTQIEWGCVALAMVLFVESSTGTMSIISLSTRVLHPSVENL